MSPRVRKRGGTRPRRQDAGAAASPAERPAGFWGDAADLPIAVREVRIAQDPSAVVRSLGPPPLPGRESISEYYFEPVYSRAVALAGALAAAGGLTITEPAQEERAD